MKVDLGFKEVKAVGLVKEESSKGIQVSRGRSGQTSR